MGQLGGLLDSIASRPLYYGVEFSRIAWTFCGREASSVDSPRHRGRTQTPCQSESRLRRLVKLRLLADRTWALPRLPETSTRRVRAGDVGSLTEECDRRQEDTSAIRCAWREPVDRTWVPIRRRASRGLFERVFPCLYREGRRGIVREPEGIETPPPGESSERPWSKHREPDIRNVQLK